MITGKKASQKTEGVCRHLKTIDAFKREFAFNRMVWKEGVHIIGSASLLIMRVHCRLFICCAVINPGPKN